MEKKSVIGMLFCFIGVVAGDLSAVDDTQDTQQEVSQEVQPRRLLRTSKKDIFELLQSTSSSDKEDERDTYAERDVSSGGSETELTHSFPRSMTPPFASRSIRIERGTRDDVDSCVLEQVARFSITSSAVHSAFAHVLEEQRRQRRDYKQLVARICALEKAVNHIADTACDAAYCREYNETLVAENTRKTESTINMEMYQIRKRMGSFENSLRKMEDHVQYLRVTDIETSHNEDTLSWSSDSQRSNKPKREPIKGRLSASNSSGSDPDISPFCLEAEEKNLSDDVFLGSTESGLPDSVIIPLSLDAPALT